MIAQVPANILQIGAKCVEVHLGAAPQFSTLEGCRMPLSCRAWGREETQSLAWVWSQLLSQSCPQILALLPAAAICSATCLLQST